MQYRMKTHSLNQQEISSLLGRTQTASLATINPDGTPYVTPVHFLYVDGVIYIHGLPAGQKIDNIKANPAVSFTAYEMRGLLLDQEEKPCDTNTSYQSAILQGTAGLVFDIAEKKMALQGIVRKYTPALADKVLPENMVKGTAVLKITADKVTGKYYGER